MVATMDKTDKADIVKEAMERAAKLEAGHVAGRGLLVVVKMSRWDGKARDRKAAAELAKAKGAKAEMISLEKTLMESDLLTEIHAEMTQLGFYYRARTLPWTDKGPRILPSVGYQEFADGVRLRTEKIERLVERFCRDEYPAFWARMRNLHALGALFDEKDYPHPSKMAAKFGVEYDLFPMPEVGDFRTELTPSDKRRVEARYRALLGAGVAEVQKRMLDVVGSMAEALPQFDPTAKGNGRRFSDSLVENVRGLVALLPGLNLTGDPVIADLTERMAAKLCRHDAEVLKTSDTARSEVAEAAEKMFAEMSDLFSA
jgi:hypothetical protein